MKIAVLLYDGCLGAQVFALSDVLRLSMSIAHGMGVLAAEGEAAFALNLVSVAGKPVQLAGGITLQAQAMRGKYDLLIVPGLEITPDVDWQAQLASLQAEIALIKKSFTAGCMLASVCLGAFLLGEAGLLNGRRATTAWLFAPELARRYPAVKLDAHALLAQDSGVITGGAFCSAYDLALDLIKRQYGVAVASATANVGLLPTARVSQAAYVDTALMARPATLQAGGFAPQVTEWLKLHLAEEFELARLAAAFHISSRTLLRRVKAETGQTPLLLLQQARVAKARELLCSSKMSIARITEMVGYQDVATFARLFAREMGETPARFRRMQQGLLKAEA